VGRLPGVNVSAREGPPAAQYDALIVDSVLAFAFPCLGVDENDVASDDENMVGVWFVLIAITGPSACGRFLWCVFDVHGVDEYCRRVPGHPRRITLEVFCSPKMPAYSTVIWGCYHVLLCVDSLRLPYVIIHSRHHSR